MSAYLHYGNVSPFRIAKEAARRGPGGQKYLDELLIWRELAYHWCAFTKNPHSLDALPKWAQRTLEEERTTLRLKNYSWETLSRGQTDDPLWNACQQSLLRQGELHNNLRMTWGKQLIEWTSGPEECLRYLIDLNHRYALDGRDPSSYGGLLWCLGLFDSPKNPSGQSGARFEAGPVNGTHAKWTLSDMLNTATDQEQKHSNGRGYWSRYQRPNMCTDPSRSRPEGYCF